MGAERNVAAMVLAVASRQPERAAIQTPTHQISYGQFASLIVSFADKMQKHGIGRSSVVALDTNRPDLGLALGLACAARGCAWTKAGLAVLSNWSVGVTHLLHDESKQLPPKPNQIRVDQTWSPQAGEPDEPIHLDGFASPTDIAVIGQSSGTTGSVKAMAITADNLWNRSDEKLLLDEAPTPIAVSLFPALHLGNFCNLVRILARGGTLLVANDYDFWVASQATFVLGAPNHFGEMFRKRPPPDRPRVPLAWVGGGPISPRFLETALKFFGEMANTYGSAEAGIVTYKRGRDIPPEDGEVPLGRPVPGTELQIVDDAGRPVPAGMEGIVRLRTPWQISGYVGDPETSARVFRDGWFYPGDVGRLSGEGELTILGRTNDQLNLGGVKVNATTVDDIIQSTPGVRDGICFAVPVENGILRLAAIISVEDDARAAEIAGLVRTMVGKKVGPGMAPKQIYVSDKIPRNPTGKPTRYLAIEAVAGLKPIELPAATQG